MCILESHMPWHSKEHVTWESGTYIQASCQFYIKKNVWEMNEFSVLPAFKKTWTRCYWAETEQAMALMAVLPPSLSLQRASLQCDGEHPTPWLMPKTIKSCWKLTSLRNSHSSSHFFSYLKMKNKTRPTQIIPNVNNGLTADKQCWIILNSCWQWQRAGMRKCLH